MQDLDAAREKRNVEREEFLGDRSFKFGGEIFTARSRVSFLALQELASINIETPGDQVIEITERAVLNMIETEGHERFKAVVASTDDPITVFDLNELSSFLVNEATKRPTQAPSLSTPGRASTGTDSKDSSSSPPAVPSAA